MVLEVDGLAKAFTRHVLVLDKAGFPQAVEERDGDVLGAISGLGAEVPNDWQRALLRARRERPSCRTSEPRDELSPSQSITSSASTSSVRGTVKPSAFAVFRFMTNSNLVGCITGRSAGFSPLRIRLAY